MSQNIFERLEEIANNGGNRMFSRRESSDSFRRRFRLSFRFDREAFLEGFFACAGIGVIALLLAMNSGRLTSARVTPAMLSGGRGRARIVTTWNAGKTGRAAFGIAGSALNVSYAALAPVNPSEPDLDAELDRFLSESIPETETGSDALDPFGVGGDAQPASSIGNTLRADEKSAADTWTTVPTVRWAEAERKTDDEIRKPEAPQAAAIPIAAEEAGPPEEKTAEPSGEPVSEPKPAPAPKRATGLWEAGAAPRTYGWQGGWSYRTERDKERENMEAQRIAAEEYHKEREKVKAEEKLRVENAAGGKAYRPATLRTPARGSVSRATLSREPDPTEAVYGRASDAYFSSLKESLSPKGDQVPPQKADQAASAARTPGPATSPPRPAFGGAYSPYQDPVAVPSSGNATVRPVTARDAEMRRRRIIDAKAGIPPPPIVEKPLKPEFPGPRTEQQSVANTYYFSAPADGPLFSDDEDDDVESAVPPPLSVFQTSSIGFNEVRMNFKSGSPDLSMASVKWLHDFAGYVKMHAPGQQVEIRFSVVDPELQTRRFALVQQTLVAQGIPPDDIVSVASKRDVNSFILKIRPIDFERATGAAGSAMAVW